jgi:hypothetical protein
VTELATAHIGGMGGSPPGARVGNKPMAIRHLGREPSRGG